MEKSYATSSQTSSLSSTLSETVQQLLTELSPSYDQEKNFHTLSGESTPSQQSQHQSPYLNTENKQPSATASSESQSSQVQQNELPATDKTALPLHSGYKVIQHNNDGTSEEVQTRPRDKRYTVIRTNTGERVQLRATYNAENDVFVLPNPWAPQIREDKLSRLPKQLHTSRRIYGSWGKQRIFRHPTKAKRWRRKNVVRIRKRSANTQRNKIRRTQSYFRGKQPILQRLYYKNSGKPRRNVNNRRLRVSQNMRMPFKRQYYRRFRR